MSILALMAYILCSNYVYKVSFSLFKVSMLFNNSCLLSLCVLRCPYRVYSSIYNICSLLVSRVFSLLSLLLMMSCCRSLHSLFFMIYLFNVSILFCLSFNTASESFCCPFNSSTCSNNPPFTFSHSSLSKKCFLSSYSLFSKTFIFTKYSSSSLFLFSIIISYCLCISSIFSINSSFS